MIMPVSGMPVFNDDDAKLSKTIAPLAGPTIRPTFDVEELARHSGFRSVSLLRSDTVLEIVPDISWRGARLDLVDTEILSYIDGVSPVGLLESALTITRDELYATLVTLLARGFVRAIDEAVEAAPESEIHPRHGGLGRDDGTSLPRTG